MHVASVGHRRFITAACVVLAGACASGGARRSMPVQTFRVVVENANWLDMNIYTQSEAGMRSRLGSVATGETRTFIVHRSRVGGGSFRLLGDPIGSREIQSTQWLIVSPGETALWKIGTHASTSWAMVR